MQTCFFLPSLREARKSSLFREKLMDFRLLMLCVCGGPHIEKARRQLDVQGAQKVCSG